MANPENSSTNINTQKENQVLQTSLIKTQELVGGLPDDPKFSKAVEYAKPFIDMQDVLNLTKDFKNKIFDTTMNNFGPHIIRKWETIKAGSGTLTQKSSLLMKFISGIKESLIKLIIEKANKVKTERQKKIDEYFGNFSIYQNYQELIANLLRDKYRSLGSEEADINDKFNLIVSQTERFAKVLVPNLKKELLTLKGAFTLDNEGKIVSINENNPKIKKFFTEIENKIKEYIQRETILGKLGASYYNVESANETKASIKSTNEYLDSIGIADKIKNGHNVNISIKAHASIEGIDNKTLMEKRLNAKKRAIQVYLDKKLGNGWEENPKFGKVEFINSFNQIDPKFNENDVPANYNKGRTDGRGMFLEAQKASNSGYVRLFPLKQFFKEHPNGNDEDLRNYINSDKLKGQDKLYAILFLMHQKHDPRVVIDEFNRYMNIYNSDPNKAENWLLKNSVILKNNGRLLDYLFKNVAAARSTDISVQILAKKKKEEKPKIAENFDNWKYGNEKGATKFKNRYPELNAKNVEIERVAYFISWSQHYMDHTYEYKTTDNQTWNDPEFLKIFKDRLLLYRDGWKLASPSKARILANKFPNLNANQKELETAIQWARDSVETLSDGRRIHSYIQGSNILEGLWKNDNFLRKVRDKVLSYRKQKTEKSN